MKQKRSARMRTRAKQKHVASDRARRENAKAHSFHPISFSTLPTHAPPALSEHRLNVSGIQRCRAYLNTSEPDHGSTLQDRLLSSRSASCPDFLWYQHPHLLLFQPFAFSSISACIVSADASNNISTPGRAPMLKRYAPSARFRRCTGQHWKISLRIPHGLVMIYGFVFMDN